MRKSRRKMSEMRKMRKTVDVKALMRVEEERDEDRLEQSEEERDRRGAGLKVKETKRKSP